MACSGRPAEMGDHKKVLITGAAGTIGTVMREGLCDRYDLRLCDREPIVDLVAGEEDCSADITDLQRMEEVVDGVNAIVHLAGCPAVSTPWEDCFQVNMGGTYCVYVAARRRGVKRIVFASSNHVTGYYEIDGIYTRPDMPERPDSFYGVSKAFGEDLGQYYVDSHGLEIVCLRIGTFQPESSVVERSDDRILSTWLSCRDAVQLVWRSIEADVSFGIYYGISGNQRAYWDIANARRELGYEPEDDAEVVR
ncbi:MAG: NAD(P)-dependent oxidoreductase [Candidatus Latescibacterota bacterium]|nr:NAD(P)-dependent oxidoreductase [Candidatus Latescibacterota bacterium]